MTNLTLWNDPWRMINELSNLQGTFDRVLNATSDTACACRPRADVWGNDDQVVVEMELPGVSAEDVSISVEDDLLRIEGEMPQVETVEGQTLYRRERRSGPFTRSVRLPYPADTKQVKATYASGVLRVTVPRAETSKPHRIQIEAA